jgi:hypothetical protein
MLLVVRNHAVGSYRRASIMVRAVIITTLWKLEEIDTDDPISTIQHMDLSASLKFCKWTGWQRINKTEALEIEKSVLDGELCLFKKC